VSGDRPDEGSGDVPDLPAPREGDDEADPPARRSLPLSARQASAVSLAVLLLGLALLSGPVLGDGPDPDRVYTYDAVPVDPDDGRSVGVLVGLPDVAYVAGDTAVAVVSAANGTYTRNTAEPGTERLVETFDGVEFVRESGRGEFYRVDGRVDGRTFRLDTERVAPRRVVEAVAVAAEDAPSRAATAAREGGVETTRPFPPTLVAFEDRYVAVVRTGVSEEPDPRAVEKRLAMALGLVLTFAGAVGYTRVGHDD
jgi:hypothetical protein